MSGYKITFGTSGWRERMDSGFNEENVLRTAYGIGRYLKETHGSGQVVVGYDARKNSDKFAELVCTVMADFGFDVLLTDSPTPTPALVYLVISRKAVGGIQVTASHNPPEYNGVKFVLDSGAAPLKDVTDKIEAYVPDRGTRPEKGYARKTISAMDEYVSALSKKLDLSRIKGMKIAVDTLHGAGGGYLAALLSSHGAEVIELHKEYDPNFGGMSPNPTEQNLHELKESILKSGASLGIANDGDADRVAILDSEGRYYGANEFGLILADYLYKTKGVRGTLVKSIQSTAAFDRLGAKYDSKVVEVPVGFKYIATELLSGAAFGVEGAALGVGFGGWIPDKDGIAGGAAVCEAISFANKPLGKLSEEVSLEYGYTGFEAAEIPKTDISEKAFHKLEKDNTIKEFGGRRVVQKSNLDGLKLVLDGDAWILVRMSGTEPKIRIYAEAKTKKAVDELIAYTKLQLGA